MSVNRIGNIHFFTHFCFKYIDEEHKRIMERLLALGIQPTGDKSRDKELLRQAEIQKFKQEKVISESYVTISVEKQKKILETIEDNKNLENGYKEEERQGAKLLGEQIYLKIKMDEAQELDKLKRTKKKNDFIE